MALLSTGKGAPSLPPVKEVGGVEYERPSEEHGRLRITPEFDIGVGEKMELVVSHCCTNANLYDYYHCMRDDRLEAVWRIAARGKSQ